MSTELDTQGGRAGRIVLIVVGVILVSALGFFAYKYFDEKGKNEVAEVEMGDLETEIDQLELDIEDYQKSLADQDLELDEKELLLAEKQQELMEKDKRIQELMRQNKISASKAQELQGKLKTMEYYIEKYQKEVDDLKLQVAMLEDENKVLQGALETTKSSMRDLEMAKIKSDNTVEAAAILKPFDFKFYDVRSRKEKEDTEFRRGRLDELKVAFQIMENPAATAGERDIYVQLEAPDGKIVQDNGKQSGKFTFFDEELPYTMKTHVNFDKTTTSASASFTRPDEMDWQKGTYKVHVFADGFDIAHPEFTIK